MTLPEIIRHATQLFNLNDPVDREIAGDWIEQQGIDETITSLTAAAIRSSILAPDICIIAHNHYGDGCMAGNGSGTGFGSGYPGSSSVGVGSGNGNGFGEGIGTGCSIGTGCGTTYWLEHGSGAGYGTGLGTGYGDIDVNAE